MMNFLKINIDASFITTDQNAGIGFILRDNTGYFRGAKCMHCRPHSSEEVEGIALLEAINWANDLNLQRVSFESDAQTLVHYAQGKKVKIDWRCKSVLDDCKDLISLSPSFVLSFVPRIANQAVDFLAKAARLSSSPISIMQEPPNFMFDILNLDTNNLVSEALPPDV
ncbi:hypothetical protein BVC80_53g18 [Macleaya cordata]|uniref:RNase H type-1 domain-containing protein n=1 Tax=Macleaya cordata TaxID=56857 RepID=A0A200QJN7_MACCD|nr:hypothetical protein BVC80_53g18 [Macleaya cordata]